MAFWQRFVLIKKIIWGKKIFRKFFKVFFEIFEIARRFLHVFATFCQTKQVARRSLPIADDTSFYINAIKARLRS